MFGAGVDPTGGGGGVTLLCECGHVHGFTEVCTAAVLWPTRREWCGCVNHIPVGVVEGFNPVVVGEVS